jgi:hypothetical protein
VAPLANHLSSTAKAGLESDILTCIRDVIRSDYAKIRRETSREQQTLNSLGNIGLYTDGSLKNSSFDLMKDLEQIHDVIFAKDIPYTGTPNTSATSLGSFFASPLALTEGLSQGATLDDRLSRDLADAGWRLNQPTGSSSGAQTPTLAALCASGTLLGGMDAGLLADLQRQTAFGNNEGSQTLP